jgi:hypothetical protein
VEEEWYAFSIIWLSLILSARAEDRWIEWLDSKIALLLDRDSVDPRAYGGKAYDE